MKRIKKGTEDIIDILTGDIGLIKNVRYYTHLEPTKVISPSITNNDNALICRLESSALNTLKSGELMCVIDLESADTAFADSKYNTMQIDGLNVWLA